MPPQRPSKGKASRRKGKAAKIYSDGLPPRASRPCYISSVPEDVLVEILMALGLPGSMNSKMATLLTSICRRWRSIVISNPHFWTTIRDPFRNFPYPSALDPFERSKPVQVDVEWNVSSPWGFGHSALRRICKHMAPHLSRLRLLTINLLNNKTYAQTIFNEWQGLQMPQLQILDVTVSGVSLSSLSSLPRKMGLHSLRTLKLTGDFELKHFPPAAALKHLDTTSLPPTLEVFGGIFNKFPLLETLIFRHSTLHPSTKSPMVKIREFESTGIFPNTTLHSLAIYTTHIKEDCRYLSKIANNLEYVEIITPQGPVQVANHFVRPIMLQLKMQPTLTTLHLHLAKSAAWNGLIAADLPKRIKLEIDRPPLGSEKALARLMNATGFKSLTIILAESSTQSQFINCSNFSKLVFERKPTLSCPTSVLLPQKNHRLDQKAVSILGAYLTITYMMGSPRKGLIDTEHTEQFHPFNDYTAGLEKEDGDYYDYFPSDDVGAQMRSLDGEYNIRDVGTRSYGFGHGATMDDDGYRHWDNDY